MVTTVVVVEGRVKSPVEVGALCLHTTEFQYMCVLRDIERCNFLFTEGGCRPEPKQTLLQPAAIFMKVPPPC